MTKTLKNIKQIQGYIPITCIFIINFDTRGIINGYSLQTHHSIIMLFIKLVWVCVECSYSRKLSL